ncbi:MAG: hypothetical protein Kilf2KO_01780 [Rhodospirillales bacterium]
MLGRAPTVCVLALAAAVFCTGLNDGEAPLGSLPESAGIGPAAEAVRKPLPRPLTGPWTYDRQEDDTPVARTCDETLSVCIAVACRRGEGLTFEYFGPGSPGDNGPTGGALYVSTLKGVKRFTFDWSLLNQPFTRRAPLSGAMVEQLVRGGRGLYEDQERRLPFSLKGSADAIDAVLLRCR